MGEKRSDDPLSDDLWKDHEAPAEDWEDEDEEQDEADHFEGAWDRTWRLPWRRLDAGAMREAAEAVAAAYAGVSVRVDWEEDDCVTAFFTVPGEGEGEGEGAPLVVELSAYDLGSDGCVLSLEVDAADNEVAFQDAEQLAEDLAGALDAGPLDL